MKNIKARHSPRSEFASTIIAVLQIVAVLWVGFALIVGVGLAAVSSLEEGEFEPCSRNASWCLGGSVEFTELTYVGLLVMLVITAAFLVTVFLAWFIRFIIRRWKPEFGE